MSSASDQPMILWSVGAGKILRVNRAFTETLGFGAGDLEAQPLLKWIHPDDRESLERQIQAGAGCVRARHQVKPSGWLSFDWRVREHGGEVVAFGLPNWDVGTLEKSATTCTDPERSSLEETLEAMALIVEAKNPGLRCSILLIDASHEYVSFGAGPSLPAAYNEAVQGLRIGPAVGSCGTAAYWNVPVIVENIAEDELWKDLRDTAALAGVVSCWSHPVNSTNGEVLGAMALYNTRACAPTRFQMDGLEIAARMVGLAIERDRLEERLRQATKMEAIGVLAGGIAHDFNNLLATVMGNTELLMTAVPEDADTKHMLQEIVTASVCATGLCNQMLAYAGRGTLSIETINCNALVKEMGGLLQVAVSKKVTLTYDLAEAPTGVRGDRNQLRQVIMNLITNASEAVGDSEGRIVLGSKVAHYTREDLNHHHAFAALEPGEYVRLWVSDTGAGMGLQIQAKIFDPFFSTKPTGRGLGLAAVLGIVQSHKGAIAVESDVGLGTEISVLIPRVSLPYVDPSGEPPAAEDHAGARILVVDDEPQVLAVLTNILESAGYEVIGASGGQEAIDVFTREADSIDCVLLDFSMPGLNGEDVFKELRKIRGGVRVVLSSGFTEQEILDRFEGAGLAGVVQKPARMHVLLAKIAEALSPATA